MGPAAQGDVDPPCLPLRGRWQREALAEGEIPHGFLSLSRLRRQPPPRGVLAARHRRADGTSYPKGICSAALHGRTPSPTGGQRTCPVGRGPCAPPQNTHCPRRDTWVPPYRVHVSGRTGRPSLVKKSERTFLTSWRAPGYAGGAFFTCSVRTARPDPAGSGRRPCASRAGRPAR